MILRSRNRTSHFERLRLLIIFAMLGVLMFLSDVLLEFLPNIHLVGALTIIYTIVYRTKALIPIYVYVMINGLYAGFNLWWVPYLYVWTVLWAVTMILPKKMPTPVAVVVYVAVCALHGLCFGILYAPFQALAFSFSFKQTIAWIISGFPFDVVHCLGNFAAGTLIFPLSRALMKLENKFAIKTL